MTKETPILFSWGDDGTMRPLERFRIEAARRFIVGERYLMEVTEVRSMATHNHFFSAVQDAWLNLPEAIAPDYASAEHLRKHALIRCGFYSKRSFVAATPADAKEIAAFLKPLDSYTIILVEGCVVSCFEAESQSMSPPPIGMGNTRFAESKESVLAYLEEMIGVPSGTLRTPKEKKVKK